MTGRHAALIVSGLVAWQIAAAPQISSIGTHIFGPELTMEDLKGHVVVFENWGKS
jgi:hypothetical protein